MALTGSGGPDAPRQQEPKGKTAQGRVLGGGVGGERSGREGREEPTAQGPMRAEPWDNVLQPPVPGPWVPMDFPLPP